jgi:hypothetical protein
LVEKRFAAQLPLPYPWQLKGWRDDQGLEGADIKFAGSQVLYQDISFYTTLLHNNPKDGHISVPLSKLSRLTGAPQVTDE